jgi:hypothetical protein
VTTSFAVAKETEVIAMLINISDIVSSEDKEVTKEVLIGLE